MSSKPFKQIVVEALESDDIDRLKTTLAAARQHLLDYGDLINLIKALELTIANHERYSSSRG